MHKRANQPRDGTSVFIAHRTRALILDHFFDFRFFIWLELSDTLGHSNYFHTLAKRGCLWINMKQA